MAARASWCTTGGEAAYMVLVAGECGFSLVHPLSDDHGSLGEGGDDALVIGQPMDASGRISCPLRSRGSHLESGALFPLSLYWQLLIRASGCCF